MTTSVPKAVCVFSVYVNSRGVNQPKKVHRMICMCYVCYYAMCVTAPLILAVGHER